MVFEIKNMMNPEVYDHPVSHIELIETHISWVILTGDFAYKIKKPVDFGFLDFSTLEKRRRCCEQELQLNRRLAPEIYLDVVAITGTKDKPRISAEGDAFEYAVKMTQFPQSAQLDNMLTAGELEPEHIDAISHMVAEFHQTVAVANDSMDYGNKDLVYQPVEENFSQIKAHLDVDLYADKLETLAQWCGAEFRKLETIFENRKHTGYVRECHGDMHLRNLLWLDGRAIAFDCIEFNPALRWIDVLSEVAFLVMDLQDRKQPQLANRFLNHYLELSGDYPGLPVLPFYLCYRAMVRAKVNALRLQQKALSAAERESAIAEFESYLDLAISYTQLPTLKLIIMRGLSASGKSTVSQQLLEKFSAIRIRSDVERKRLFNIASSDHSTGVKTSNKIDSGIYNAQASQQTYAKLAELASQIISAGYSVIVDATFLQHAQREIFQTLADQLAVPYIILEVTAPAETLRQRIRQRKSDVSDADLSVLEQQLLNCQALQQDERSKAITVDTAHPLNIDVLIDKIESV